MKDSPPSPPWKRTRSRYIISFALVFLALFVWVNSSPSGITMGTGANHWCDYGFPSSWFRLHTYATHGYVGDHWEDEFRVEGAVVISWRSCLASIALCGGLSAALVGSAMRLLSLVTKLRLVTR